MLNCNRNQFSFILLFYSHILYTYKYFFYFTLFCSGSLVFRPVAVHWPTRDDPKLLTRALRNGLPHLPAWPPLGCILQSYRVFLLISTNRQVFRTSPTPPALRPARQSTQMQRRRLDSIVANVVESRRSIMGCAHWTRYISHAYILLWVSVEF